MKPVPLLAALLLAACNSAAPPPDKPEPASVISQTSDQAAVELVKRYYDVLERKDFAAADRIWRTSRGDLAELHAEVGKPGPSEGACGSIYIEVPVRIRSRLVGGVSRLESGKVVLRRVNNVDGATPDQLNWHIASIELSPA